MKILGLAGLPRSGKDSVGRILVQSYGFARCSFAAPIKDMLIAGLGLTRAEVEDEDKERVIARLGTTPRYLMQTLGTEWGREMIGPDTWLSIAEQRSRGFRTAGMPVVFTDVRFENEATWIRRLGGAIWHVLRPLGNVIDLHASNRGITVVPGVDSVLTNDEGLAQLERQVEAARRGELVVPVEAA